MRRYLYLSLLAAVGLFVVAGVVAASEPRPSTQDVSAAFTTEQVRSHSRTCTQGGNTFRITNALWRGTSTSSEPRLAGALTIATRTVVNETTGDGWLHGSWRTLGEASQANPRKKNPRPRSWARLSAVIDNGNHFDGLATGHVKRPWARLLGNWSAMIVGNTLSGELGANVPVAPDNAAILYRGGC